MALQNVRILILNRNKIRFLPGLYKSQLYKGTKEKAMAVVSSEN